MSTLAQEEADRLFSHREHHTSHPEDRLEHDSNSRHSYDNSEEPDSADTFALSEKEDDEDTLHNMTSSTATYRLPTTLFDANTGPKGVIADAQSFNRAKKHSVRSTIAAFANSAQSAFSYNSQPRKTSDSNKSNSLGEKSDSELGNSDDEDFMRQWRENRFRELASRGSGAQRRNSPSKRVWGTIDDVDANGYLDAVEKVPRDAIVVVCIYDPEVRQAEA